MKIKISLSADLWYHGSPFNNVDFNIDRTTFFTRSLKVATAYAKGNVMATGKQLNDKLVKDPTVYQCTLKLSHIFDMRKQWAEYEALRKAAKTTLFKYREAFFDGEDKDPMPKLESEGFIMNSGLPSFGRANQFKVLLNSKLNKVRYEAMYIDEGSQGLSIAIFDPRHKVTVSQKIEV